MRFKSIKLKQKTNCFKNNEHGLTLDAGVLGKELANLFQIDAQFNDAKRKVIIDDLFDKVDFASKYSRLEVAHNNP